MGNPGFAAAPRFAHRPDVHHRHGHRRVFIGAPFVYGGDYGYGYGYGYGDACYWLRRRALYTGSPYWWNRYYACASGYSY